MQKKEIKRVRKIVRNRQVTLLYSANDTQINHAIILRNILIEKL